MSLILSIISVLMAALGVYLLVIDAGLVAYIGGLINTILVFIDSGNHPFAKGVIMLGIALAFAILAIVFHRQKHIIKP